MGSKLIPSQVIRFQDSKSCLWVTKEEATAAEAGYVLDEQLRKQKEHIIEELYNITSLTREESEEALHYIFKHYTLTPRKGT